MAYDKQIFTQGQVLTATHLNHIENGIAQSDAAITALKTTVENNKQTADAAILATNNNVTATNTRITALSGNVDTLSKSIDETSDKVNTNSENARNTFSNAIKGTASGSVVTLTDVSPIEHEVTVRVHGKNLWNNLAFSTHTGGDSDVYVKEITIESITITAGNSYTGNGHVETWVKLRDVCPQIVSGNTYILQGNSSAWIKGIYLRASDIIWYFGASLMVTEDILNSTVGFYGFHTINGQVPGDNVISNIQLECGKVSTDYVNYIDPTASQVSINGELFTTTDESGAILGVNSTYPNMTFETAEANMVVSVEYNRDATTVINDLLERVSALENA